MSKKEPAEKKQYSLVDFASRLLNTPIALDAKTLDALLATFLHNRGMVNEEGLVDLSSFFFLFDDEPPLEAKAEDGIATINIVGPLSKDRFFGTQYGEIRTAIDGAMADDSVDRILLNFDSPGGTVSGMFELADYIYQLRSESKPIWSLVNDLAASAAYALASGTQRILTTETGTVGSIGVLARHVDVSEQNKASGVKITHIFAGDRKVDGSRDLPLSKEARNSIQADVDAIYDKFVERVETHRSDLTDKAIRDTEGATYLGEAGVDIGFADGMTTVVDAVKEFSESNVSATSVTVPAIGGDTEKGNTMTDAEKKKKEAEEAAAAQATSDAEAAAAASADNVVDIATARNEGAQAERAARQEYVSQVKSLCTLAGCPAKAIDFIEADTSLSDVQKSLLDAKAKAEEEEEEEVSGHQAASPGFKPRTIDAAAIYRKRRETAEAYGLPKFE
jgi:signal peptide peptidase SppA